jgi:hypothetical protein
LEHQYEQASSSRLDSWDLENIRYIRNKSEHQHRLLLEEYCSSLPRKQADDLSLEDEAKHIDDPLGWVKAKQYEHDQEDYGENEETIAVVNNQQTQLQLPLQFHTPLDNEKDEGLAIHGKLINDYKSTEDEEIRIMPPEEDEQLPSLVDPNRNRLDDCYLLDVLTIGNESVLKETTTQEDNNKSFQTSTYSSRRRQRHPSRKISGGIPRSLGTPTNSSPSSSSEEEAGYLHEASSSNSTSCCSRTDISTMRTRSGK